MTLQEYQREYQKKYRAGHREMTRRLSREAMRRWREDNPQANRERNCIYKHNRRAMKLGARVEKYIRVQMLHNWESKLCGICGVKIEGQYHLDHIVPLSRGGEHSVANLQLAHPYCNQSKFNHLPDMVL